MKPQSVVVLLQLEGATKRSLVAALSNSFSLFHQVDSVAELRNRIGKYSRGVAIVDLEKASLSDVEGLVRDFPATSIVCTHRCADDQMWTAALNAGALDVYSSSDIAGIVRAALASCATVRSVAA
jgi:hypothetical protein